MNFDVDKKMTPQKIKDELDKHIIGQDHVKKSLASSLRNIILDEYKYLLFHFCFKII
jgi:ATP-dependent protease Clp ATPase subunit